jgi:hypothetical protein
MIMMMMIIIIIITIYSQVRKNVSYFLIYANDACQQSYICYAVQNNRMITEEDLSSTNRRRHGLF